MPDEVVRSVVQFEAETEEAESGLTQLLAAIKRIETAVGSLDTTWKSAIQTVGDTSSIRVHGLDKLQRGLTGVRTEIKGMREDFRSGEASMRVVAETAETAASQVGALEMTLDSLRARQRALVLSQQELRETSLAPLFNEADVAGQQVQETFQLTVGSLEELNQAALKTWESFSGLGGGGSKQQAAPYSMTAAQQESVSFFEEVMKGERSVQGTAEALLYLRGAMTVYSTALGQSSDEVRAAAGAASQYAGNLAELGQVQRGITATEAQLASVRASSTRSLETQAGALQESIQALRELPAAIREAMGAAGGETGQAEAVQKATQAAKAGAAAVETQAQAQQAQAQAQAQSTQQTLAGAQAQAQVARATQQATTQAGQQTQATQGQVAQLQALQQALQAIATQQQAAGAGGVGALGGGGAGAGGAATPQPSPGLLAGIGRQLQTHLRWMARYIILWKGLQLIQNIAKQWFEVNVELDRSLALLETSIGDNVRVLREYRDAMFEAAAAGRALPTEMAGAAVMTGRIYEPAQAEEMMTRAAELAFVSGDDPTEVMGTLIVMQRQLGIEGDDLTGVMDALAGSLRNTHLTYADMVPMLERAVTYSHRFNMTIEETIGLQAGVAAATGATTGQLDGMMRGLVRAYDPMSEANAALRNMGIVAVQVAEDGEKIHMPFIAIFEEVAKAIGDDEQAIEELSEAFFRTGSVHRTTFETAIRNTDVLTQSYRDAVNASGEFDKSVERMGDTWAGAMASMSTGWQTFLASLRLDEATFEQIERLGNAFGEAGERVTEARDLHEDFMDTGGVVGAAYRQVAGILSIVPLVGEMAQWSLAQDLSRAGIQPSPRGRDEVGAGDLYDYPRPLAPAAAAGAAAAGLPSAISVKTAMLELPEGASFEDIVTSYNEMTERWIGAMRDQTGAAYRTTRDQVMSSRELALVWDENAGEMRVLNAFMPALQEAIKENTAALKSPNLRFTQFDPVKYAIPLQRLLGYYERVASGLGFNEEPQAQVLWGPDDSILTLSSTNIALQMVMHALTEAVQENTEAMNEGMWNIPEGVTALVPITSLFYQNLEKPGAGGLKDADIAALVAQILASSQAQAPMAGGAFGGGGAGGGLAVPPGAYDYYVPGRSPYTPLNEAGGDLTRSATILTRAGYALGQAANRVGYRGYQGGEDYDFYLPPIPKLGRGGIVTQPTVAMIGDKGPEAVVPLGGAMAGQEATFHITLMMNERVLAEVTRRAVAEVL